MSLLLFVFSIGSEIRIFSWYSTAQKNLLHKTSCENKILTPMEVERRSLIFLDNDFLKKLKILGNFQCN